MLQLFIDNGVDLNVAENSNGLNVLPITLTFQCEHPKLIDLVRLLIGNRIQLVNYHSLSPLHFLFWNPHAQYAYKD